jgi:hypothetical protein
MAKRPKTTPEERARYAANIRRLRELAGRICDDGRRLPAAPAQPPQR